MADTNRRTTLVIWLIAAQEQLENAVGQARQLLPYPTGSQQRLVLNKYRQQLDALLRQAFPGVQVITVLERLGGYSCRPNHHILRVEVRRSAEDVGERTDAHVVKVGLCEGLCKELIGRQSCDRPTNERARTLLGVRLGACPRGSKQPQYPCPQAPPGALGALIYEDAFHTLRAGHVRSLEDVFLDCVRLGTPAPATILTVFDQVFHELHHLCYERAPAVQRNDIVQAVVDRFRLRLKKGADRWRDASLIPGERRVEALAMLPQDGLPCVDLLDFYARAFRLLHYLPEVRFGRAHGDLHGRNIFVGLVDGEACWPAVFDFEDMAIDHAVAWDFVKLETELKIRALQFVCAGWPPEPEPTAPQHAAPLGAAGSATSGMLVQQVYQFELALNEATEAKNRTSFRFWHDEDCAHLDSAAARLRALLLGLRRRAKRYLQVLGPARKYRWLHEYYFFLACYGVYAGQFENYTANDCLAAYLGASCAATRYAWGVEQVYRSREDGKAAAQQHVDATSLRERFLPAGMNPAADAAGSPSPVSRVPPTGAVVSRWDVRLEELKTLARSSKKVHIAEAVDGLDLLSQQVPAAAEIVQELAFALLELAAVTDDARCYHRAMDALLAFEKRQQGLYSRDVELLCRWGRLWKDCGDRALKQLPASTPAQPTLTSAGSTDAAMVAESGSPSQSAERLGRSQCELPLGPRSTQNSSTWPDNSAEQPSGTGNSETEAASRIGPKLPAHEWYRTAATYYRRAYEISKDYYPGINLATLAFLIRELERGEPVKIDRPSIPENPEELARDIRRRLRKDADETKAKAKANTPATPGTGGNTPIERPPEPEDAHWRLATLGEACLLLGDTQAVKYYTQAWTHKKVDSEHAHQAIKKQAERITRQQAAAQPTAAVRSIHRRLHKLFGT